MSKMERMPPSRGTMLAQFSAQSYDADAHTVEVVLYSGAKVSRWYGSLTLSLDAGACDLSRVESGQCKLLDSHNQYGIDGILGSVLSAQIKNGQLLGTLKFADTPSGAKAEGMVAGGTLTGISVGYQITRMHRDAVDDKDNEEWIADTWTMLEASFVSVPADPAAGVLSAEPPPGETQRNTTMDETAAPAAPAAPAPVPPAAPAAAGQLSESEIRTAERTAERSRARTIRERTRAAGLTEDFADRMIEDNLSADQASNRLFDELAARAPAVPRPARTGADNTDPAVIIERMSDALALHGLAGFGVQVRDGAIDPTRQAAARPYMQLGMLDMFADLARARGEKIDLRMPKGSLYEKLTGMLSLSTSDFPLLLASAANKILLPAYEAAAPVFFLIASRETFNDFKAHHFLRAGDFPDLLEKGETGEFAYGSLSESDQTITLIEYGRIVRISRRIIINDDLSAFAKLPRMAGERAAAVVNKLGFNLFALNSNGGPSITEAGSAVAMWHANHNNLTASGTAISIDSLGVGRAAMLKQKSLDGLPLNIMPRYLMVSPDKITLAEQYCSSIYTPNQPSVVNPFAGKLIPITDGNITTANPWYMFADPTRAAVFVYGYLNGQEGPRMATQEGFTTEGVDLRCAVDYGCGGIDFRGTYKNAGA